MLRPLSSLRPLLLRSAGPFHTHHGLPNLKPPRSSSSFTTTTTSHLKQLPPRPKPPPESEIEESFLKGSGPGGQKINKTNSAVQLKHVPTNIVVKCQATRSRDQNRKIARELLAQKIDDLAHGAQSRTAIVGDLKQKRAASKAKKARRKYKKLADAEAEAEGEGKEDGEDQQRGEEGEEEEEEKDGDWEKVDSERAPPDTEADNTKGER